MAAAPRRALGPAAAPRSTDCSDRGTQLDDHSHFRVTTTPSPATGRLLLWRVGLRQPDRAALPIHRAQDPPVLRVLRCAAVEPRRALTGQAIEQLAIAERVHQPHLHEAR